MWMPQVVQFDRNCAHVFVYAGELMISLTIVLLATKQVYSETCLCLTVIEGIAFVDATVA